MIDRAIQEMVAAALRSWKTFGEQLKVSSIIGALNPMPSAVGFKLPGFDDLLEAIETFAELGPQVHIGPVDDRFIATVVLPPEAASVGIRQIKLLQRRPSKPDDEVGLDHLDVLVSLAHTTLAELEQQLRRLGVDCEVQSNAAHSWLSIRTQCYDAFTDVPRAFEIKLVDYHVATVCIQELAAAAAASLPV